MINLSDRNHHVVNVINVINEHYLLKHVKLVTEKTILFSNSYNNNCGKIK